MWLLNLRISRAPTCPAELHPTHYKPAMQATDGDSEPEDDAPASTAIRTVDRAIMALAIPAIFTLIAEPIYLLTDTAIVGRIGTDELGGLAVANTVILFTYAIFVFLTFETTANIARLAGAGRVADATRYAVQALWLSIVLGAIGALVLLGGGPAIIRWLAGTSGVADAATTYVQIASLGMPALFVTMAGAGYFRGLGNTRRPLAITVGVAVVNLVAELVMISWLGFGIGASAATTVVAQTLGALCFAVPIIRAAHAQEVSLRPAGSMMRSQALNARPLVIRTIALRAILTACMTICAQLGAQQVASFQVAFGVWMFLVFVLDGIEAAAQSLIGNAIGAEHIAQARLVARRAFFWSTFLGILIGLVLIAARWPLAHLLSPNDQVASAAAIGMVWAGFLAPISGPAFAADGILVGSGHTRILANAMVVASIAFAAIAAAGLAAGWGVHSVWLALGATSAIRTAIGARAVSSENWPGVHPVGPKLRPAEA